jgi:hypothetical protein
VEAKGNKAEAARILGIQRRLLYEKLTKYALPDERIWFLSVPFVRITGPILRIELNRIEYSRTNPK